MSSNGFHNYISKALLHRLKSNVRDRDVINEITEIFFRLPYVVAKREQLVKRFLKKIRRCLRNM